MRVAYVIGDGAVDLSQDQKAIRSHTVSEERELIYVWFNGPLDVAQEHQSGDNAYPLCNFLNIIEGRKCRLTQIGIGRRSLNPSKWFLDEVGYVGSR